jgi:sec-independent protein translocase protein TatA
MPTPGPLELIIILVVVLLLFGSTKLPKLARSIGEASKEFKKGVNEGANESGGASVNGAKSNTAPAAAQSNIATPAAAPDDKVTMTKAELDALLAAEREAQARKDAPPS